MNKRTIFKAIALTNFVVLFIVFLMFRNGSFNSYFNKNSDNNFTSSNGGVGPKYNTDSLRAKIDSTKKEQKLQQVRLSSSKSLVAIDYVDWHPRPRNLGKDSMLVYPSNKEKKMMQRSNSEVAGISKSGMMIAPELLVLDSLLKEKEKQKKPQ
jgi:hypothetical protein